MHCVYAVNDALTPPAAKRKIREILATGGVFYTDHALREMAADGLNKDDVTGTLRAGVVQPAEWESDAWRYRVRTNRIVAVVEFLEDPDLMIVTAWRLRR